MTQPLTLYVVAPPGPTRQDLLAALGTDTVVFDAAEAVGDLTAREPGVLLLDPSVSSDDVLALAVRAAAAGPQWCVALIRDAGDGTTSAQTVSVGLVDTLDHVAAFVSDPTAHADRLLELRRVLSDAGRLRHDVNNALTVALAETQILLLDPHEDEVREALEMIQAQLRRIGEMTTSTGHLRLPHS